MRNFVCTAALASMALMSPALAQISNPPDGNKPSATETPGKAMQADSTKPHPASNRRHPSPTMSNSSDTNGDMAHKGSMPATKAPGAAQ